MAGASNSSNGSLPNFFESATHPEMAPGTVTASQPSLGICVMPLKCEGPNAFGARPEAFRPCSVFPSQTVANESEPSPLLVGSSTVMQAAVAIPASTAFPPRASMLNPACAASGCDVATMFAAKIGIRCDGYGKSHVNGVGILAVYH